MPGNLFVSFSSHSFFFSFPFLFFLSALALLAFLLAFFSNAVLAPFPHRAESMASSGEKLKLFVQKLSQHASIPVRGSAGAAG